MRSREQDALERRKSDESAADDVETKSSSDVMQRLVAIEDALLKRTLIQRVVTLLQEPLTESRVEQIDTIVANLPEEVAPVRALIESASFWKEAVRRAQSYCSVASVT